MSRERLAAAYDALAEAYGQVAHELRANETPARDGTRAPASSAGVVPPSAPAERLPQRQAPPDTSAFTHCPAHPDRNWSKGRYGEYCTGQEPEGVPHDGGWYNDKGYCRVTPKSAGAWLKQHPNGPITAPVQQIEDVDDVPF